MALLVGCIGHPEGDFVEAEEVSCLAPPESSQSSVSTHKCKACLLALRSFPTVVVELLSDFGLLPNLSHRLYGLLETHYSKLDSILLDVQCTYYMEVSQDDDQDLNVRILREV
ncbi:hypothetical protein KM043_016322 [Ampulex compressa]|nr:hypothetical protein KM043_016322 [Ampulex compressa]